MPTADWFCPTCSGTSDEFNGTGGGVYIGDDARRSQQLMTETPCCRVPHGARHASGAGVVSEAGGEGARAGTARARAGSGKEDEGGEEKAKGESEHHRHALQQQAVATWTPAPVTSSSCLHLLLYTFDRAVNYAVLNAEERC